MVVVIGDGIGGETGWPFYSLDAMWLGVSGLGAKTPNAVQTSVTLSVSVGTWECHCRSDETIC